MNTGKKLFAATLLMSCIGAAMASDTATLQVTGAIIPSSCKLNFDGGGVLDFGILDIESSQFEKTTTLNIYCTAPLQVQLNFIDNSPSDYALLSGRKGFSLVHKEKFIASYAFRPRSTISSGNNAFLVEVDNGEIVDGIEDEIDIIYPGGTFSFTNDFNDILFIKDVSVLFGVQLDLDSDAFTGLKEKLAFEGSATVELTYL